MSGDCIENELLGDDMKNCYLTFNMTIQDSPFFHACRQNHEDHLDQIFRWVELFTKGLRNSLEEASGKSHQAD